MLDCRIDRHGSLTAARERFRIEVAEWVGACLDAYEGAPPTDGHDQATYTTAWLSLLQDAPWHRARTHLRRTRDAISAHFAASGSWQHGYWRLNEAHHGTEHFELFLGMLWQLEPGEARTVEILLDAAEHLGNWSPEIPPWFDWDTGLFLSTHFGTSGINLESGTPINVPDHIRCVNIALLAAAMSGEQRYLDLAHRHAGRWIDAILDGPAIPVALAPEGPVYAWDSLTLERYRRFAGQASKGSSATDRAENLIASGAVEALLRVSEAPDGNPRGRAAAERILDVAASHLADPDAGCVAALVRTYARRTGSRRYDAAVVQAVAGYDHTIARTISLEPEVKRPARPPGFGKRQDMPNWYEDGAPRPVHPVTLWCAGEILGDVDLQQAALERGCACLQLARRACPDGRHHGCAAGTVSAIARGHGRDNGAGVVTAVLAPALGCAGAG